MRGVLRPTVTEGDIIVRSNSNATTDGSLDGLNRDITRSREITKNKETYTDIYISPAAIAKIYGGFKGIRRQASELSEKLQKTVLALEVAMTTLPPEHKHLGQAGLDAMHHMLNNGISEETVHKVMSNPEFQAQLGTWANMNKSYAEYVQGGSNIPQQPVYVDSTTGEVKIVIRKTIADVTYGQYVYLRLEDLDRFIQSIPYEEERTAVLFGIQLALGGPVKMALTKGRDLVVGSVEALQEAKQYIVNTAHSYLQFGISYDKLAKETQSIYADADSNLGNFSEWKEDFEKGSSPVELGLTLTGVVGGSIKNIAKGKASSHDGSSQSNTSGAKRQDQKINGQQSDPVKGKVEATSGLATDSKKFAVPVHAGTAQSRINVAKVTYDNGHTRGFDYAMGKHGINSSRAGKSHFSIPDHEVRILLQQKNVVKAQIYHPIYEGGVMDTNKFVRQVDVGKAIGKYKNGETTSLLTVITDKKGNLINAFPGKLQE